MARALIAAAATLALAAAAPAHAATAKVEAGNSGSEAVYTAAAGEKNDVLVKRLDPQTLRISDAGASITTGSGCTLVDDHTVDCSVAQGNVLYARVSAGDGSDRVRASATTGIRADGGLGDDTLIGDDAPDFLNGGGGDDRIVGRGGNDYIYGGSHDDRLYGQGGEDSIYADSDDFDQPNSAEPGSDVLSGGADSDSLDGGAGPDVLSGAGGSDILVPGPGADAVSCGSEYDRTSDPQVSDFLKPGCEDVSFELAQLEEDLHTFMRVGAYPVKVRRASVDFVVGCPQTVGYDDGECNDWAGRLRLRDTRGRALGSARVTLRSTDPGPDGRFKVRLNRRGRSLLARPRGARVVVAIGGERLPTRRWTVLLRTQR
jgi:hypothetical protein